MFFADAFSFLMTLGVFALLVFLLLLAYKYRNNIADWVKTPPKPQRYIASEDRKLRLKRRIEDSRSELDAIEKKEAEAKQEE